MGTKLLHPQSDETQRAFIVDHRRLREVEKYCGRGSVRVFKRLLNLW